MLRRRSVILLLAAVLIGGNAAVVQLVAWGSMLVERAQRMEIATAVASTFDGSAPCRMCRMAESLRDEPSPAAPAGLGKLVKKADAPVIPLAALLVRGGDAAELPSWPVTLPPVVSVIAPELPPPRALG